MSWVQQLLSRRLFLQASGATGFAAATAGGMSTMFTLAPTEGRGQESMQAANETRITKSVCHQCPARCGIDIYTRDGRMYAIYGTSDNPISNGKLCPKGHLGTYILYDPDRFKQPMKRTNPDKGRDVDPGFVPISWEEAYDTIAARINRLRERGEAHRFATLFGRGWGASDAGILGPLGQLIGTPNSGLGHSSICSDGSKCAKDLTDGNYSYSAYDYANCNNLLIFGAGFLEAFRPYNNNMQQWGTMRSKSPRTTVTAVDVHMNTTLAASDRSLIVRPGTDGALALAIAHVMLVEGLWDREFVGDFEDQRNAFATGETIDPDRFIERWVAGLPRWWNEELKDRTPKWAAEITGLAESEILATAREFGGTRPAIALFERGPTAHSNGTYNGMAIHALNALAGSLFAEGGIFYQMPPAYGPLPVDVEDYMDDTAREMAGKYPRIDMAGTERYPLAHNMMQEIARNHLAGDPYKLDTAIFYLTNPIWTAPDSTHWEDALREIFVVDTSPFPGETAQFADLVLPEHTYPERLMDVPTYPFQGWPMAEIRSPAVEPLYDTRNFSQMIFEIGKRINGPTGDYYRALDTTENFLRHLAAGFRDAPGDNGVTDFESWQEKGVWYRKPYQWRQWRGDFYEWDGQGYNRQMSEAEVAEKLLPTPSGRFELFSEKLQSHADFVEREFGIARDRAGLIQWVAPRHTGSGDLHLVSPKTAMHAEGRGANIPQAIEFMQPVLGGNTTVYLEMHPRTARDRGIRNDDRVRITSDVGTIDAYVRLFEGTHPDTVVLPMEHGHWAQGRWAEGRMPGHSGYVTANQSDKLSGLANYYSGKVNVEKA